jgi:hypothetical protein
MSEHPYSLVCDELNELSALASAIDAFGVYAEHSGSCLNGDDLMTIGLMMCKRIKTIRETLEGWELPPPDIEQKGGGE